MESFSSALARTFATNIIAALGHECRSARVDVLPALTNRKIIEILTQKWLFNST
jgi:hypothetical protein